MVGVSFSVTVKRPLRIFVPPPRHLPRETPLTASHVSPPEPTSGGACPRAGHVGLQLEEIRGSGDGRGVFLALGMF